MCVYSMVMDHYWDKWKDHLPKQPFYPPAVPGIPQVPQINPAEIEEFRRLLDRAREYDKKHNQPDCELEEKRERLRKLAKELGVEIGFV